MFRPKVWAHRGGRRWPSPAPPENTLAAFRKCLEFGVHGIEIDVHKCKTGELVVLHGGVHGGDVAHHTNSKGLVKDLTWDEIKALHMTAPDGSELVGEYAGERIPLFSEVLQLIGGRCIVFAEIKNNPWEYPGFANDLIDMVDQFNAESWVVLSSFEHGILREIHRSRTDLLLGMLIDGLLVDIGEYAAKIGCSYWHPYLGEMRTDYVAQAREAGLEIHPWTANTEDEWELALKLGVDGIVTDDPVGLTAYLDRVFPPSTTTAAS